MAKKIVALLLTLALLGSVATTVSADNMPDHNRVGSIRITMTYHTEPVPGGSLTLFKVADVADTEAKFVYTEAFAGCTKELTDLQDPALAAELAQIAAEQELTGTEQTIDEKGCAKFEARSIGLYLLVQTEPAGGYNKVNPFLVSLPGRQEDTYIYDVDASPKVSLEPAPTEPAQPTEPTVPPTEPPDLPQTGQLSWPVPVLAIGGLILVCIGWLLREDERKKKYEKENR